MSLIKKTFSSFKSLLPKKVKQYAREVLRIPTLEGSLQIMRRNGFAPSTVIDIGAYAGDWTRLCKRLFPNSYVLMVEPQKARYFDLERVVTDYSGIVLSQSLLGATEQSSVGFYAMNSASSVLPETVKQQQPTCYLSMTTLDKLTDATPFEKPDLIKLDVQGFELEVLRGGMHTLTSTEAVIIETNLIAIYDGAPLFHEVVSFMAEYRFYVYDICTFFRRPYDNALWQVDLIFVNQSSELLASKRWA